MENPWITVSLPLIGAAIGYMVKQFIERRKELLSEVNKERRDLYQKFVDLMIEILTINKSGNVNYEKETAKLYDFYKKYILYASPSVIIAFSDYFQMLYRNESNQDQKSHLKMLSRIMLEMRKDLGLSNRGMGKNGEKLLRALIKDIDEYFD